MFRPHGEGRLVVGELGDARPVGFVGGSENTKDTEQLIDFGITRAKGAPTRKKVGKRGVMSQEKEKGERLKKKRRSRRCKNEKSSETDQCTITERKGGRGIKYLLAISAKIIPIDQMSTGHAYWRAPRRISGARYQRVTT